MSFLAMAAALVIDPSQQMPTRTSVQDGRALADPQRLSVASPSPVTATVSPITVASAFRPADNRVGVELSMGTSVASGDFGASSQSSIRSTAVAARATLGSLRLTASIPYMRVRSATTVFTGIDSTPVVVGGSSDGPKRTNDGLGDMTVGASYTLPHQPDELEIEVSGRVKLPTASRNSGLSSRQTDYSVGLQATKVIGRVAPFVSATYRILGDLNDFDLRNGVAASAGASYILDSRTVLLGSYHYARAASRFVRDGHELFLGGSRELGVGTLRLTGFGTAGLSSGAAAVSGGVAVSVPL